MTGKQSWDEGWWVWEGPTGCVTHTRAEMFLVGAPTELDLEFPPCL